MMQDIEGINRKRSLKITEDGSNSPLDRVVSNQERNFMVYYWMEYWLVISGEQENIRS